METSILSLIIQKHNFFMILIFVKFCENFKPSKINEIFIVRQNGRTG